MNDVDKLKPQLKNYLQKCGIDVNQNPCRCFSPDHEDSGKKSCLVYDDYFSCKACSLHGDIFDACGILTGKSDFKDQKEEIFRTLGIIDDTPRAIKKKDPVFSKEAIEKINNLLKSHPMRESEVKKFLSKRGYDKKTSSVLWKRYGYWPGLNEAKKIIPGDELFSGGIPEPKEGKTMSSWSRSGVVFRLASGWMLLYYKGDDCLKRKSSSAKTFPFPAIEENQKEFYLVEAETSAASLRAIGFKNVHATGGVNGITRENAKLLKNAEKITFLYDGDNPGRYYCGIDKALLASKAKTPPETAKQKIINAGFKGEFISVNLANDKDPDDYVRAGAMEKLYERIKKAARAKEIEETPPVAAKSTTVKNVEHSPYEDDTGKKEESQVSKFRFLGYDDDAYYFLPKDKGICLRIANGDSSIKNKVLELCRERAWWISQFNKDVPIPGTDGGTKTVFDAGAALEWIRGESEKVGNFNPELMKGAGVYLDKGKIILNNGSELIMSDGSKQSLFSYEGNYCFVKSKRKFTMSKEPWNVGNGKYLFKQISKFGFDNTLSIITVLGYMTIAPFAGALNRKPSIWITATRGSGKSFLLENFIEPACGGENYAFMTEGAQSSEAGLRAAAKHDRIPMILDEFDPGTPDKKVKEKLTRILTLLTSAYGNTRGVMGSASQKEVYFDLQSMFCLASVNLKFTNAAQQSRVIVSRLNRVGEGSEIIDNYEGLRKRTFDNLLKILNEIDICKKMLMKKGKSARTADTFSPILVSAWNTLSDHDFFDENDRLTWEIIGEAISLVDREKSMSDEEVVIEIILQHIIKLSGGYGKSVAQMLLHRNEMKVLEHGDDLERHGIRLDPDRLLLAVNHKEIKNMLLDTAYEDYNEIVKRNRFVKGRDRAYFAGSRQSCIVFDWEGFRKEYLDFGVEK